MRSPGGRPSSERCDRAIFRQKQGRAEEALRCSTAMLRLSLPSRCSPLVLRCSAAKNVIRQGWGDPALGGALLVGVFVSNLLRRSGRVSTPARALPLAGFAGWGDSFVLAAVNGAPSTQPFFLPMLPVSCVWSRATLLAHAAPGTRSVRAGVCVSGVGHLRVWGRAAALAAGAQLFAAPKRRAVLAVRRCCGRRAWCGARWRLRRSITTALRYS